MHMNLRDGEDYKKLQDFFDREKINYTYRSAKNDLRVVMRGLPVTSEL